MCGIVGLVGGSDTPEVVERVLRRQLALLRHRGPDDARLLVEPGFAFGHTRLAIIDPEHGAQPFVSDDGNLVITFNGEIYNYIEIREELRSHGHAFRTASDTEVLLNGFRQWGEGVLQRLDGMFAFAIYDRSRRELFCARDPYGQKPFYYVLSDSRFAFSSECRTFSCLPGFASEADLGSIADFLAFECFPFDRSIYRGVHKLPPGHSLRLSGEKLEINRYFESIPRDGPLTVPEAEAEDQVRELLRRSVMRTFRADVPVGLLLSGGLDSSLVLALLREIHPAVPLRTYTIRNVDPSFDESEAAALLAREFHTQHTVVTAAPSVLAAAASELPSLLDEPQADPGILPKYVVCREIGRTSKVALTGDGGDEFFYGYAIFKAQRAAGIAAWLPDLLHRRLIRPLVQQLPASDGYMGFDLKAKQFARGFPAPAHLRNFYWTSAFPDYELPRLLLGARQDFTDLGRQFERLRARWQQAGGTLGRLAFLYQQQYLPDYVLTNSDRSSMLNSVELRTPFLATDLVRMVNSLPDRAKMRGGETKRLLRRIARKLLPAAIHRRRKMGFTAPVGALIKGALKDEICEFLGRAYLERQGLFEPAYVATLLEQHFTNRHNHYKQIWALFMLQKWLHARGISVR